MSPYFNKNSSAGPKTATATSTFLLAYLARRKSFRSVWYASEFEPREIHRLAIGFDTVWGVGSEGTDKFDFKTCQTRKLETLVEKHNDVPCRGRRRQGAGDQGDTHSKQESRASHDVPAGREMISMIARKLEGAWPAKIAQLPYVRFGSKADMCSAKGHVRSTPKSGHCLRQGSDHEAGHHRVCPRPRRSICSQN